MNVNHCNMGFIFSGSLSPVASSRALRPQLDFRNNKGCLVSKSKRPRHKTAIVNASAEGGFDLGKYHEAVIGDIKADKHGHCVYLRLKDGQNSVLPIYIGDFECGALVKEITKKSASRPSTHDLMKTMLEALGYRVCKIRITALVGMTYHARVHFSRGTGYKDVAQDIDIDARPSDAMNLAVRFGAAIYVNKDIASKMAHPMTTFTAEGTMAGPKGGNGSSSIGGSGGAGGISGGKITDIAAEIIRSCREEIMHYNDPTIMHKLALQVAVAEERFEDASKMRDVIDKILASDRALSLVVAIETALEDHRFDEAARLRDEFMSFRAVQEGREASEVNISDAFFGEASS